MPELRLHFDIDGWLFFYKLPSGEEGRYELEERYISQFKKARREAAAWLLRKCGIEVNPDDIPLSGVPEGYEQWRADNGRRLKRQRAEKRKRPPPRTMDDL